MRTECEKGNCPCLDHGYDDKADECNLGYPVKNDKDYNTISEECGLIRVLYADPTNRSVKEFYPARRRT